MPIPSFLLRFAVRQDGALTAFGLFILLACIVVGGMSLDVSYAMMARTQLQVAADSAAHAAILTRERAGEAAAKEVAIRIAGANLPERVFGDVLRTEDIHFGTYDPATDTFTAEPGGPAVLINSKRLLERENALGLFFMRFVGLDTMDVRTNAVFTTYGPPCFQEGFVAGNRIDIQSNNTFVDGFCLHTNGVMEMNRNNTFQDGTIVSFPSRDALSVPGGRMDGNPGLADAIRTFGYPLRILGRIEEIEQGFDDIASRWYRDDYFDLFVQTINLDAADALDAASWVPGAVHSISCSGDGDILDTTDVLNTAANGNGRGKGGGNGNGGNGNGSGGNVLTIPANTTLVKGAIVTDCELRIGAGAALEDVIVISKNESDTAITGTSKVRLGRDDGCQPGGGVQLVTRGGMQFSANLEIYGGQLIAAGSIRFAANADGLEGVSMIAGDTIDGTSNMTMGFCEGDGMENIFTESYFRLAR